MDGLVKCLLASVFGHATCRMRNVPTSSSRAGWAHVVAKQVSSGPGHTHWCWRAGGWVGFPVTGWYSGDICIYSNLQELTDPLKCSDFKQISKCGGGNFSVVEHRHVLGQGHDGLYSRRCHQRDRYPNQRRPRHTITITIASAKSAKHGAAKWIFYYRLLDSPSI